MEPLYILIALLALPVIALMVLRINASLVFLSLCLGNVLVQFVSHDAGLILFSAAARAPGHVPASQAYINLALLLLPVVLTSIIMIHSVKGPKLAFNFLPALGVGVLLTLLAVPLLSAGLTGSITGLPLWDTLLSLQTLVLSVTTMLCLLFLWMQRPKRHSEDKDSKHH